MERRPFSRIPSLEGSKVNSKGLQVVSMTGLSADFRAGNAPAQFSGKCRELRACMLTLRCCPVTLEFKITFGLKEPLSTGKTS